MLQLHRATGCPPQITTIQRTWKSCLESFLFLGVGRGGQCSFTTSSLLQFTLHSHAVGKDRHSQIVLGHGTKQSKNDKVR